MPCASCGHNKVMVTIGWLGGLKIWFIQCSNCGFEQIEERVY